MKLKCQHNRRVMVLPSENVVHRQDGSACDAAETLKLGGERLTPWEVAALPTDRASDIGEWVEATDFKVQTGW